MDQQASQMPHDPEPPPIYVAEYHLILRDKKGIEDSLKNPAIQKFIWFNIVTLILKDSPKDKASEVLAELRSYARMLPEVEKVNPASPNPRKVS